MLQKEIFSVIFTVKMEYCRATEIFLIEVMKDILWQFNKWPSVKITPGHPVLLHM